MIINLHGIDGNAYNTNYRQLVSAHNSDDVITFQLDYRSSSLESIVNDLISEIDSLPSVDFIVGNSFGGFIAQILACRYCVPCILTNPCLRPDLSIDNVVPGYTQAYGNMQFIKSVIDKWQRDNKTFANSHIIFGDADEVLDTRLAYNFAKGADSTVISGNHRLSGQEFEDIFRKMVLKIETRDYQ